MSPRGKEMVCFGDDMAHFSSRKPPEGLSQISDRVFVFGCCCTKERYQLYARRIASRLRKKFPDSPFMVHDFGDENHHTEIAGSLSDHGMTVIDYGCQYQKYPLLTAIHRFLSSSGSWLSANARNVILIVHCQNSALTKLAFLLATILIYKMRFCDERKALDMMYYKQAPREILQSSNSLPSQLRCLEYVLRRGMALKWAPTGGVVMFGGVRMNGGEKRTNGGSILPATTMKIESSKVQLSNQRPAQSKVILAARTSPDSISSKVPSIPISRYRSVTSSVLGITALLHDHAESSNEKDSSRCPFYTPTNKPISLLPAPSPPLEEPSRCLVSTPKTSTFRAAPIVLPPPPPPFPNAPATSSSSPPPPPPPKRTVSAIACSPISQPARIRQVIPPPPLCAKGKFQPRTSTRTQAQPKNTVPLKPYHWLKLTRAMQGSLWAEVQKPEEASKVFEFDMTEIESLFSTTKSNLDHCGKTNRRGSGGLKPDKVNLIELRRAYNCEIMLSKVKVPLSDLMSSVLALDDAALDIDQVDNLIKFCPTKEEIELLTNYKGDKENLGKCEQFFMELIKVPRVESKLRVFSFKIQFFSQVSDLRRNLKIVNSASEEVKNSVKLKRIMQTILSLGNKLNHGTARGSAVGFRLDSLLKLGETRSQNNKLTLIHYLCKLLAENLPEVMDFHRDLVSLEAATKIQLKYLAEEMQAIGKGLEKIAQELNASENDGALSKQFFKTLKEFYGSAEEEVRSLASVYSVVGRNADALSVYFGEDPSRCPFEQVVSTLLNFVRMFGRAHEENRKQLEFEKKKKQKETENVYLNQPSNFIRQQSEV